MHDRLTLLKMRLVLQVLEQVPDTALHALIILEAEAALSTAVRTGFPLLIFPCLFAEHVTQALRLAAQRSKTYWRLLTPLGSGPQGEGLNISEPLSCGEFPHHFSVSYWQPESPSGTARSLHALPSGANAQ
jgi:hypothetical protein